MENVLILVGLGMDTVMMELTINIATMMEETVVELLSILNTAQNVSA